MTPSGTQLVRDIREPLFDTYTIAKNTAMPLRIILFGNPSTSGVGATKPEVTNLTMVGQLPNPEHHDVYTVMVDFINMLAADVMGICQAYVLRVAVSGRNLLTLPLHVSTPFDLVNTIASDIIPFAQVKVDLPEDYKISIDNGAPFYAEFVGSTAYSTVNTNGQGAYIRVKLDGVHTVMVS
jgi:hypothetical protein